MPAAAAYYRLILFIYTVVRSLFRNMDVMRMALSQGSGRNLDKSSVCFQLFYCMGTTVSHTGTQTSHKLEHCIFYSSLISHTSLNTFRNKLLRIFLEIAVFTSIFHSGDRTHTAVYLVFSSLVKFKCS